MTPSETRAVIVALTALVKERYVDEAAAAPIAQALTEALAAGRYSVADDATLADVVSTDLQSVNGDKHLRLVHHADVLPEREPGTDTEEYAAMQRWASDTCGGIGRVQRLEGNIGIVEISPVLFPAVISASTITAAMSLVASASALILDLRGCLGGDPDLVAWLCSYLYDHEPVELTALDEPRQARSRQSWTLPFVPGQRFGRSKPVWILTSATTFSGGEQLSYDLQALGRATIVGEQTRGGANARESFRLHPHLEATISVARAVNPITGSNWESVGVAPDVAVPAATSLDQAHRLALEAIA
jgi:C-terminal processing protease CtpA/Prc